MKSTSSSDFSHSQRSTRNETFQYRAGGIVLLNTTKINFQQNGFLLLKACKLCIPSYQQSDSNLSSVAQCLKEIGQHFKYPYLLEFTPGTDSHHRNMSNYIEIARDFSKGYIVKSSLASVLFWLSFGLDFFAVDAAFCFYYPLLTASILLDFSLKNIPL